MPKTLSEETKLRMRQSVLAHAAHIHKQRGVQVREFANLEDTYKKYDGDPLELPWNDDSAKPPLATPTGYIRCTGSKQAAAETINNEGRCAECGKWFRLAKSGQPWPHKAKETANA